MYNENYDSVLKFGTKRYLNGGYSLPKGRVKRMR